MFQFEYWVGRIALSYSGQSPHFCLWPAYRHSEVTELLVLGAERIVHVINLNVFISNDIDLTD